MAVETTTQEFDKIRASSAQRLIVVSGGSVVLAVRMSNGTYADVGTYNEGAYEILNDRVAIRVTPAPGASYEVI